MSEQLKQLLDQSHCLTRRQMKDYAAGTMTREEAHAIEQHLNGCPFCSAAVEGMQTYLPESLEALAELNTGFLKEHFGHTHPEIHLNSMAPAAATPQAPPRRKKARHYSVWQMAGIAAGILLFFGVIWYLEFGHEPRSVRTVAQGVSAGQNPVLADSAGEGSSAPPSLVAEAPSTDKGAINAKQEKKKAKRVRDSLKTAASGNRALSLAGNEEEQKKHPLADTVENTSSRLAMGSMARTSNANERSETRDLSEAEAKRVDNTAGNQDSFPAGAKDDHPRMLAAPAASAQELFRKKDYAAALPLFRQQMSSGTREERQEAVFYAARCYLALGQKTAARRLLQQLYDDNAPQKHEADQLLKQMDSSGSRQP